VAGQAAIAADLLHAQKICLTYLDIPIGAQLPTLLDLLVLAPRGLKLDASVGIPPTAADLSAQASALSGCDAVVAAVTVDLSARLISTMRQLGVTVPVVLPGGVFNAASISDMLGDPGDVYVATQVKHESSGYEEYEAAMDEIGKAGTVEDVDTAAGAFLSVK